MNIRQRARELGEEYAREMRELTATMLARLEPSLEALAGLPELADREGQVETLVGFMIGIGDVIPDPVKPVIIENMTSRWAIANPELVEEVLQRLKKETQQ